MKIQINSSVNKNDSTYIVVLASCMCALVQLYALPNGNDSLVSLSVRVLQLIWLLAGGMALYYRLKEPLPKKMADILVVLILSCVSYMIAGMMDVSKLVQNGVKLLGFFSLPLMLFYGLMKKDERIKRTIILFHILTSILYIGLYCSDLRHALKTQYGIAYVVEVTLGYANANQAAMYLLVCAIGLMAGVFYFRRPGVKIVLIVDTICIAWILWQTDSRAAIIAIVTIILILITLKWRITKLWVQIIFLIPLVYLLLPLLDSSVTSLRFMNDLLFNGREVIYRRYFDNLDFMLVLVGDMNTFAFDNLHNGYLAIAASVGLFTCVYYLRFLTHCVLISMPVSGTPNYERVAFVGFLCLILHTGAEASYLTGGVNYAFLVFSIFALFAKPYPTVNSTEEVQYENSDVF